MTDPAPETEDAIVARVREARAAETALEIRGGGTRSGLGRPVQAAATLSVANHRGITLYEPGALTLVAKAGTPLAEIEAALAAENQMLPFEPMDHRGLLGSAGEPTLGGVVACGVSGPRRIQAGACRDYILGMRFVTGEGTVVKSGGRVMKNVTGYDLAKLLVGAYGTLGVITEAAFKVLPAPERAATLALRGLSDADAVAAMASALGSPFEVSGAAHLPEAEGGPLTALRVEGLDLQVAHRLKGLAARAPAAAAQEIMEGEAHAALWRAIRDVAPFHGRTGAVWRISVKPGDGPGVGAALRETLGAALVYDWGGGLIWALVPEADNAGAEAIRATVGPGGHATLIRAPAALRAAIPPFQPRDPRLAALERGLRARFDPDSVLNPGRMAA
jgi:glycolate oxidase FAD binding subunit